VTFSIAMQMLSPYRSTSASFPLILYLSNCRINVKQL